MKITTSDPVILAGRTGDYVNIVDPDPSTIHIEDIAFALSRINRYTGHTKVPYNVAEHCIRVSSLIGRQGYGPKLQLAGLLHDASEAYLGDVATPLKRLLTEYKALEDNFERVIEEKFNVQFRGCGVVKTADLALLQIEREMLMPMNGEWEILESIPADFYRKYTTGVPQFGKGHSDSEASFLSRYRKLKEEVKQLYG